MSIGLMKKTPLHAAHLAASARMVDFGGWHMPVQYSGLSNEHHAVRTKAGLFDVSHMGEVIVEGENAEHFLNTLVTNNVSRLVDGQALYTVMCYEHGGIVDDLLVYKRAHQKYLLCINAGNIDKDYAWIDKLAHTFTKLHVHNASNEYSQVAIQGPLAEQIVARLTKVDLKAIKYYHFAEADFLGAHCILSRTGYTGEDGFEIYAPAAHGEKIWNALMDAGAPLGLIPAGLGARDTLRMEMKFPLYGHEITEHTHPLEAGLGWVVKLDKPTEFIGKSALVRAKSEGMKRHLVGVKSLDRGIPRQGYEVYTHDGKEKLGEVTSGTMSPSLGFPIAIAYVKTGFQTIGNKVSIKVRDNFVPAEIVSTPFYKK